MWWGVGEGRPTSCGPLVFSAFVYVCILRFDTRFLAVIWLLKNLIFLSYSFFVWVHFSKMYFPRRADKRTPKIVKSPNVRILSIFLWFYPFPYTNSMQNTSTMHLNTSEAYFEGSGTGKYGKHTHARNLTQLKTCPPKHLGYWIFCFDPILYCISGPTGANNLCFQLPVKYLLSVQYNIGARDAQLPRGCSLEA